MYVCVCYSFIGIVINRWERNPKTSCKRMLKFFESVTVLLSMSNAKTTNVNDSPSKSQWIESIKVEKQSFRFLICGSNDDYGSTFTVNILGHHHYQILDSSLPLTKLSFVITTGAVVVGFFILHA